MEFQVEHAIMIGYQNESVFRILRNNDELSSFSIFAWQLRRRNKLIRRSVSLTSMIVEDDHFDAITEIIE